MLTLFFRLFRCFVVLMCAFFVFSASAAQSQNDKINDSDIATKLGIKVQQVHSLRAAFNLSTQELIDLTQAQLAELLRDLEHPGIEKQGAHMEEQLERMRDEHGGFHQTGSCAHWNIENTWKKRKISIRCRLKVPLTLSAANLALSQRGFKRTVGPGWGPATLADACAQLFRTPR